MSCFLAVQAADPFDPAPMLIQADWLEERGDLAGAEHLRRLAAAGIRSIAMLAIEAAYDDLAIHLPSHMRHAGFGLGDIDALGFTGGCGDGFGDSGSGGRSRGPSGQNGIGDGHWYREEDFQEFRRQH